MNTTTAGQRAVRTAPTTFFDEVCMGLRQPLQKELPSKYLYDAVGSALFEAITVLPEYGVTRAEEALLAQYASDIVGRFPQPCSVAELGSGSGRKTRRLLEALPRRRVVSYNPIEISPTALQICRRELSDIERIAIVGHERDYLSGLAEVSQARRQGDGLAVLFLGSTIGNFNRGAAAGFLGQIRALLQPGDVLLLGADLDKPLPRLLAAYDDAAGVTAAFNLNLLGRINRELDADFDLRQYRHAARYNAQARSIEMHLVAREPQRVTLAEPGLTISIERDESIWTESSHKYRADEVISLGRAAGFGTAGQWFEHDWGFAETLLVAD
jgi:L-histidine N-alpha-methyltransferase